MDKVVFECLLKKAWKECSVQNVLSVESSPAVGKFQNFLSVVNRLNIKLVLGNGRVTSRSIIKKVKSDECLEAFEAIQGVFETEIKMYTIVISEMESLMDEFEDTDDVLWPRLIDYTPYNCLVLEDLKGLGFSMLDRNSFLDLDHCMLAVHSLGRLHGMSKVLEERGVVTKEVFRPWFVLNDTQTHKYIMWSISALLRAVEVLWDPTWYPIISKIKLTLELVKNELNKLQILDETKFNLMNHGDCNKNNLFFKYDWQNRPFAIRFLDFQLTNYGSPCIDLTYLLYVSTQPSVRQEYLNLVLNTYHSSLTTTLEKFHYKGTKPSFEEIMKDMEKFSFMGLLLFLSWHPAISNSERMDELIDREKLIATEGEEGYSMELFNRESFENDFGPDLKAFANILEICN